MRKALTDDEYADEFARYSHSAFRLELRAAYAVGFERDLFDKFRAGIPEPPDQFEEFRAWYDTIREKVAAGVTFSRVRIFDTPPTDYQRWTRYMDRWNTEAGEVIHYLAREDAARARITRAFGGRDFWLFDDRRVVIMSFDTENRCIKKELSTSKSDLQRARSWRDLAITTARGDH